MEWGPGLGVSWHGQEKGRIVFFCQGLVVLPPAGYWEQVLCSRRSSFWKQQKMGAPGRYKPAEGRTTSRETPPAGVLPAGAGLHESL